jgi:glucosamine--fructose-6-phosphate aminotransferase (isomerizing)
MKFADGIVAQPEVLAASRDRILAGLGALPTPRPDDVLALIGVGASDFLARGAARAWRDAGLRAFAVSAAEVTEAGAGAADVVVAISESGRSTETIEAVRLVDGRPTVAVVNAPESPLARACTAVLHQDSGDDSPVYTTGYTAALQALGLLGEHWSGRGTDWTALPGLAREVLDGAAEPMVAWSEVVAGARIVDVVAAGVSSATAGEGALLLRESARLHTAAHETRNYLHGPMEPLDPETACVIVGSGREVRLARDTAALGCPTLLLTSDEDVRSDDALTVLRLPRAGSALASAVLEMLPFQLLALAVAGRRGLAVDGFRYSQDDTKDDTGDAEG